MQNENTCKYIFANNFAIDLCLKSYMFRNKKKKSICRIAIIKKGTCNSVLHVTILRKIIII